MHKILIIIDKYGWSYDTIARGLIDYSDKTRISFIVASVQDDFEFIRRYHTYYDLVFAMGWTLIISKNKKENYQDKLAFLDRKKLITGIHSHRSWDNYLSLPNVTYMPPQALLDKLNQIKNINVVSKRLYRIFQDAGLKNVMLTENGVDTELFKPTRSISTDRDRPLVIGFSGSKDIKKHDYLKGFSEFILPLNRIPNVEVKVLGGRGTDQVNREDMPALYNQIDLYICASTSEGFSQSVLEASACGRGVLSTVVGGCEDLITEHHNGFFINRDVDDIKRLVVRLESDRSLVKRLGENNRQVILATYAWRTRVKPWLNFISSNLPFT